jgi:hypothetical protein
MQLVKLVEWMVWLEVALIVIAAVGLVCLLKKKRAASKKRKVNTNMK